MNFKPTSVNVFLLLNGALCLTFMLVFRPVPFEVMGDSHAYIALAKQMFSFPDAPDYDLSYKSPLYSVLLGMVMLISGQTNFQEPVIILQYFMVFLTSVLIYHIFKVLTGNNKIAFFSGLFSTLNLSTIFYAYNILSEILSLFIFTLMVHQVILYYGTGRKFKIIMAGLLAGLLVLARFNALGIPLVLAALIIFLNLFINGFHKFQKLFSEIAIVSIGILLVLNFWALYNYQNKGAYNIFPPQHAGQRWAIPSTINKNNVVSDQYKEVLHIFLIAKEKLDYESTNYELEKGSLLSFPIITKLNDYFKPATDGYFLYCIAEQDLLDFYNLPYSTESINILGKKLRPFYNEITNQNNRELFRLRIYSFLSTFRHNSPTIPGDKPINLNSLPSFIIRWYKLIFIFAVVSVFIISLFHIIRILISKDHINGGNWIILYAFIWYFPLINFYANVLGDANRFKFPAESIIIGLFVYHSFNAFNWVRKSIILRGSKTNG